MTQLVSTNKESATVFTTSRIIAEQFGKEHSSILQDVKELDCTEEFREGNFAPSSYNNTQNKSLPMYNITRDGFSFLCQITILNKLKKLCEA